MADDRKLPQLSSDGVAEQFTRKMQELTRAAKEREVEERAHTLGIHAVNLTGFPIGPETLLLIPRAVADELHAITFFHSGSEIRIGAVQPDDARVLELAYQLGERNRANVGRYAISPDSFRHAYALYDTILKVQPIVTKVSIPAATVARLRGALTNLNALGHELAHAPTSDLVTIIVTGAIEAGSSDIHIEAEEDQIALRYRIDGVLREVATIPKDRWKQLMNRVKLLAGLKLNVTDVPQDGRVTIAFANETMDVRVSTLPTAWGESIVMRLLIASAVGLGFDGLGLRGRAFEALRREVERPNGMIVTTGPTGSGKTTTLYAILAKLNTKAAKIITLEDPIEYKVAGLNQSQIDPSRDYTFAKGLRAILRQDPDVVMVGEIRDLETAEVAIQAALTGHLMLSTIHTNSAAGAIPRFLSMGVKPFLLAPALNAIIGQRLVRKVHADCAEEVPPTPEQLERVRAVIASMPEQERAEASAKTLVFRHGKGCDACHGAGMKGRIGIYEIFTMSKAIETVILSGKVSEYEMEELARSAGMVTMLQDGILKALDGSTSLEEVFRVVE